MQFYSSATTLGAPSKPVEIKIPVWWADGTMIQGNTGGTVLIADGVTSQATPPGTSANQLHTFSTKWTTTTKVALEVTMCVDSGYTANAQLYDLTASALVSGSLVTSTSVYSAFTVVRSSQFTMIPGHVYGISLSPNTAGHYVYMTDASLIVFP